MTPREAVSLQRKLRTRVEHRDRIGRVRFVAGFDASYHAGRGRAAIVVFDVRTMEIVESKTAEMETTFPYIPGLLAFREVPVLQKAFRKLETRPHLGIVDAHGFAHPRRYGSACHIGITLDLPVIGCAKSLLIGKHEAPGSARGSWTPLMHHDVRIGAALRTQDDVQVVYVSTGHRVSLRTAIRWTLKMAPRYRLTEPIRAADSLAAFPRVQNV